MRSFGRIWAQEKLGNETKTKHSFSVALAEQRRKLWECFNFQIKSCLLDL